MNYIGILFLTVNVMALLLLPRNWAALPLLAGTCYMTLGQQFELGPFNFPVIRILILVGFVRIVVRGERLSGKINSIDGLMLAWAAWAVLSSLFHQDAVASLVNRLGLIFNACGIYFILRVLCYSSGSVLQLCRLIAILLIPLSIAICAERATGHNFFSIFGGVEEYSEIRGGVVRAQGPFAHSILAGSAGASTFPLMLVLWRSHRFLAAIGVMAALAIVFASASSGPILSLLFAILALIAWYMRHLMRFIRWLAVLAYVALDMAMNAPAYFVLARIDLTGSSTSWHRAELIDAAIRHLSEWWLVGSDYTRHWISYGVGWNPNHTDITNYYINMGVYGGLMLLGLFVAILAKGFAAIGYQVDILERANDRQTLTAFGVWAIGASLFTHAVTFISVSYFDQSVVFLYMVLAAASTDQPLARDAVEPTQDKPVAVMEGQRVHRHEPLRTGDAVTAPSRPV